MVARAVLATDDVRVRSATFATAGAVVAAVSVMAAEATEQWRDWGCAAPLPAPPCTRPPFWHWSDVSPLFMVVGAAVGALLAVTILALGRRERARREQWGES